MFLVVCNLHWHTREDACSRTGGIFIRDTALDTAYSLWFSELWPNQGQTMRNHTPYHTAYTTVWRMILGRMHALKCKKISCITLQKSIEAMVMKEKRLPQITLSLLIKTVNKRGERSSQSYYKSNVPPYRSCYHSFCMRSSGVWNWGCILPNWWRYGVWYVVVRYE